MKFTDVIGQDEAAKRLTGLVAEGRLPHALMLCGPEGSGKMALALAFASYLLCERHDGADDSCGECRQCKMAGKWEHPDLHFTFPTIKLPSMSAEHKPVSDDFARQWRQLLAGGPYFTMNQECANKLLKLIEEPPSRTVFVMVSEEPDKLLDTIRSRTQRIDIRRIGDDEIRQALTARRGIDGNTAARIARMSGGSWLRAIEALEAGNENELFLDMFIQLMRLAYMRNVKELKRWSETMQGFGREKQKRFLTYFMRMARENFMYNFQKPEIVYMTQREEDFARNFARFVNENNILQITDLGNKAIRDIGQNANAKIVFFDMALQMIVLLLAK